MVKIDLEPDISLETSDTPPPGTFNAVARIQSVKNLAALMVRHEEVMIALTPIIVSRGKRRGFGSTSVGSMMQRLHIVLARSEQAVYNQTVKVLKSLANDYESYIPYKKQDKSGDFTSGISEAVAEELIRRDGWTDNETHHDVRIIINGNRSVCNLDFALARKVRRRAVFIEAKNNPMNLLKDWRDRNDSGSTIGQARCKMYWMLEVREHLMKLCWKVGLGCFTLQDKQSVTMAISIAPPELRIICLEDIQGGQFPSSLIN